MKEVSTRLYASHRMPPVPITKARMEFLSRGTSYLAVPVT